MKIKILSLVMVLSCTTASAAAVLPNSSGDLRALEENRAQQEKTAVLTKEEANQEVSGNRKFYLEKFVFTSTDELPQDELAEMVQSKCRREVDFNEVQQAVDKVTMYLRGQGYAVATAFLPQQEISGGVIELRIVLGRLGAVQINNTAALADSQAQKAASVLKHGELLRTDRLETILNNLSDLAGITAVGILRAGQAHGTSDFVINIEADLPVETILYTDNYGNKYSGRYRYGFQTTINNPGKIGDKFFLGGMLSNDNLHNYNLGYEMPVGSRGTKLGVSYSLMDYTLSGFYNILDAVGRAKTFSIYGTTPLVNTSSNYLAAVYGYDNRQLQDELRVFGIDTKKHSNALHAGIVGNVKGSASYTGYSALYYAGHLTYDDASSYTEGSYHKFNTDINHIRRLGNVCNLHLNFHGQLASKDLDGSEQFVLGGANGVRAYPQGEASGDSGYQATAELRYATPLPNLTLATYIDWGEVELGKSYGQHRNLAGWGIGLQYARSNDYYLRLDYARKLNGEAFTSEENDKNGRLWFLAYKML